MGVVLFVVALVWGSLSAQFLVQVITSLVLARIYAVALFSSKVPKSDNLIGVGVSAVQAVIFAMLFVA
jgi:hypothetical protein